MANNATGKRKQQQRQAVVRLLVMAAILVCINILAARFHYGMDLTKEKRFTLTTPTKKLLRNMDDVAVIDVYLKGKFPAGFQRLSEATRERLQALRDVAGSHIVFRFTDPMEGIPEEKKKDVFEQLASVGVNPVNLRVTEEDEGYSEKLVFPYALVNYHGRKMPVKLLENRMGYTPLESLNYAESMLEYKFANAINKLSKPEKPEVAYIMGHGESLGINTFDILNTIGAIYKLDTLDLKNSLYIPAYIKAIIINKPTIAFDDKEKFKIDQYVMSGGKVLWCIDQVYASMDSLRSGEFVAVDYGLNLDDQLFKYGVRINTDFVQDYAQSLSIPVTVDNINGRPDIQLRKWIYFPYYVPAISHPIVKNMDAVMSMFANSIDTIANSNIQKTILLQSSKYSRTVGTPSRVSLSMLKFPLQPGMFHDGDKATAVLLEGKFTSVFNNRLHPDFLRVLRDSIKREFKPKADTTTSMIVISDGDIMENDFTQASGPTETGYWRFEQATFANKSFILNCLEYLTDNSGLLEARSKDVRLRTLDKGRVKSEKSMWRIVNIGIPVLLVLVFASCYLFFRKRRYEKKG